MKAVMAAIGLDEIILGVGLVLLTVGLWAEFGWAALAAPGVVLVWIALPARSRLIASVVSEPRRNRH